MFSGSHLLWWLPLSQCEGEVSLSLGDHFNLLLGAGEPPMCELLQRRDFQTNPRALGTAARRRAAIRRGQLVPAPWERRERSCSSLWVLRSHRKIEHTPQRPTEHKHYQDLGWERGGIREGAAAHFLGDCPGAFL